MKPIRIKVKYLLGLSLLFVLLASFGSTWLSWAVDTYNGAVPENFRIEWALSPRDSLENENQRLERLLTEQDYNLYDLVWIEDGAISSSGHIRQLDARKVYAQYLEFRRNGLIEERPDYLINVALVMWFSGLETEAEDVLGDFDVEQVPDRVRDQYHLIQTGIALTRQDLEKVDFHLQNLTDTDYQSLGVRIHRFVATFFRQEEIAATEKVDTVLSDDRFIRYFNILLDALSLYGSDWADHTPSNGPPMTVSVTDSGMPLSGVFIYADTDSGMSTFDGFEQAIAVTGQDGKAVIDTAQSGSFRIGLIIPWHIVHDAQWLTNQPLTSESGSVTFAFSPGVAFESLEVVDGMLRYTMTDSKADNDRTYRIKIRSTNPEYNVNAALIDYPIMPSGQQGEIPLEDLIQRTSGTLNYGDPSEPLQLEELLEPLYLSDEYYFELNPVETDRGQYYWNGLFSDALAYPLEIEGQLDLSEGDRLLEEGRFEEAIAWHETDGSLHSLKVLVELYSHGYEENDSATPTDWRRGGGDIHKAVATLERLIDEYGETTQRLSDLAQFHRDLAQYPEEQQALERLLGLTDGEGMETTYIQMRLARSQIDQGDFLGGLERYHTVGDPEMDGDRYLAYDLLGYQLDSMPKDYRNLIAQVEGLEDYHSFFDRIVSGQYLEAWNDLRSRDDSDTRTFFTLLMLDRLSVKGIENEDLLGEQEATSLSGFLNYYVEQTRGMQEGPLKALLIKLKADMNWFD